MIGRYCNDFDQDLIFMSLNILLWKCYVYIDMWLFLRLTVVYALFKKQQFWLNILYTFYWKYNIKFDNNYKMYGFYNIL